MIDDLATFLRACVDEAGLPDWHDRSCQTLSPAPPGVPFETLSCNCGVPTRAEAHLNAVRQLLDEHHDTNDGDCAACVDGQWGYPTHGGSTPQRFPCRTLRLVAAPYAGRPGYREEWRP
ncbi:DUF6221 family protein [Streptomyces sediminimaris]|uniref:DUF6221 family protein n=1 Tax=Streptomyces sediminimaris TaxID=3383721 RepID=UPI00399AA89B